MITLPLVCSLEYSKLTPTSLPVVVTKLKKQLDEVGNCCSFHLEGMAPLREEKAWLREPEVTGHIAHLGH